MNDRFDFDALARDVAGGFSRREALRRLGTGLAAGLLAELTGWLPAWPTARAQAATVAPSLGLCFPEIVTKGSLTSWQNFSASLELLQSCVPAVCSAFGGGVCCGGKCCASNACCNNVCVGLQSDPKNCGACGRACGTGETCSNGICVCGSSGQSCAGNQLCCGGTCCPSGQCCTRPTPIGIIPVCCPSGQACCSGGCANLGSDPRNCGACGHACASGQCCVNGACVAVNTQSDPNNCGACGHRCVAGHACCGGVCCDLTDQSCCGGVCCAGVGSPPGTECCSNVCVNTRSDPKNCGSCGHACPTAPLPFPPRTAPCCNGVCCSLSQSCQNGVCV